ncbi:hypothetical protein CC80DRAFT_531558 [Byssothecium circinans]|uniref:Rhodopsin domain-containing protein n=1 Tax=Byssothecium circinans TaxID=147558 RepID=A0A6A5UFN5_9PLEO|nr:hypothetical protein CC80DRAFT_531558 [Byssothecium circinans]
MFDQTASAVKFGDPLLRSNVILIVLTTFFLVMRLSAKSSTKARFGLDDACIVLAQLFFYTTAGTQMRAAYVGKHLRGHDDPMFKEFNFYSYISGCMYAPTVVLTAVSILFFYRRIFPVTQFKRIVDLLILVQAGTGIGGGFAQIFVCRDLAVMKADAPTLQNSMHKCINYPAFFLAILTIELTGNVAILLLPIQQIVQLKLDRNTRGMLVVVFLLGGISIISAIVRIVESYLPGENYVDVAGDMFWLGIHEATAIIAASLPVCRPLVRTLSSSVSRSLQKVYIFSGPGSKGSNKQSSDGSYPNHSSKGYISTPSEHSQRELVRGGPGLDTVDREIYMMDMREKSAQVTVQRTRDDMV